MAPGHLNNIISGAYELFDQGGVLIGAFNGEVLAGVTGVENKLRGAKRDTLKMDMLFVSKEYRNQGIGRQLVSEAARIAKEMGATKLVLPQSM